MAQLRLVHPGGESDGVEPQETRRDRLAFPAPAAGLLYSDILDPPILDWLSGFPDLWAALLYVLAGQYEHAGILGELVVQADRASVAQALGGDPAKAREAPQQALQRKLLDGLRYLVRDVLRLNQPEASDGWLTQDALWLVSKTVCDRLRAHLLSQGIGVGMRENVRHRLAGRFESNPPPSSQAAMETGFHRPPATRRRPRTPIYRSLMRTREIRSDTSWHCSINHPVQRTVPRRSALRLWSSRPPLVRRAPRHLQIVAAWKCRPARKETWPERIFWNGCAMASRPAVS